MPEESEVTAFIKSQLLSRTEYYDLYGQLDDLSGGARIKDITIVDISYERKVNGSTEFFGTLLIEAIKEEGITSLSFTGVFEGYFNETNIELESASLDVSSTSGEGTFGERSHLE